MKIEYLGHSCFKLTESKNISIVCDPFSAEIGYKMPKVAADIVTVSHHHFDHDFTDGVVNDPVIIDKAGNFNFGGLEISSIESFHDDAKGKKRGRNLIFKFKMDGVTVCHLGDLGENYSADLIEKISPVDVLLVPVGGNYTIDAQTAKKYVEWIKPHIVIPMHYSTKDSKIDIAKVDEFLNLFDGNISEENCLDLSINDIDTNDTKIILLRRV